MACTASTFLKSCCMYRHVMSCRPGVSYIFYSSMARKMVQFQLINGNTSRTLQKQTDVKSLTYKRSMAVVVLK